MTPNRKLYYHWKDLEAKSGATLLAVHSRYNAAGEAGKLAMFDELVEAEIEHSLNANKVELYKQKVNLFEEEKII